MAADLRLVAPINIDSAVWRCRFRSPGRVAGGPEGRFTWKRQGGGRYQRASRPLRKAMATVSMAVLVSLLTAGGLALIWFPVEAIINFEYSPTLTYGSGFGPPASETEQRTDLILDSILVIGMGVFLLGAAVVCVRSFISYLRE
jgi:hypothetical protein